MAVTPVFADVPAESDLVCVGCGYILRGLPESGNCPECGRPVAQSLERYGTLTPFEAAPSVGSFARTTADVLFRPAQFFRSLARRQAGTRAAWFGRVHCAIAASLLAQVVTGDLGLVLYLAQRTYGPFTTSFKDALDFEPLFNVYDAHPLLLGPLGVMIATGIYLSITLLTRIAERVTVWLAATRGESVHLPVVRRATRFCAAHLLPVALLAAATSYGHLALLNLEYVEWRSWSSSLRVARYLLGGEAMLGAAYLFVVYRNALKGLMCGQRAQ